MKKETLQQIFKRTVTKNLLDVIFVKPTEDTITPEDKLLRIMNVGHRIKVQSVVLPTEHQLFALKSEEQFLNWMGNTIHSQHTAYYQMTKKYDADDKHLGWSNNKTQNQRYLEWYGK
jgi:hypothetical protein